MSVGLDLLEVARMERLLGKAAFMRRVFSERERAYIFSRGKGAAQTAAGLYCAKEALAKASGLGLLTVLREHEVLHEASGRPFFSMPGTSLSITHTETTAAAVVLAGDSVPSEPPFRLPQRGEDTHKGHYGTLLILAGSLLYSGAARLCAAAAVRAGAGRVCVGVPRSAWGVVAAFDPCYMTLPLPETVEGFLSVDAWPVIREKLETCGAAAAGPGLGRGGDIAELMRRLLEEYSKPIVLDADGLVAAAPHIDRMSQADAPSKPWVLTPHEGEFARIGGNLSGGREGGASTFARETNCVVHLKGHHSLTAQPDGTVWENRTGNAGLAKGGSGDVLTGLIGAFLARGILPAQAAAMGAWTLGRAGDLCAGSMGQEGMTPADVLGFIPEAMKELTVVEASDAETDTSTDDNPPAGAERL